MPKCTYIREWAQTSWLTHNYNNPRNKKVTKNTKQLNISLKSSAPKGDYLKGATCVPNMSPSSALLTLKVPNLSRYRISFLLIRHEPEQIGYCRLVSVARDMQRSGCMLAEDMHHRPAPMHSRWHHAVTLIASAAFAAQHNEQ